MAGDYITFILLLISMTICATLLFFIIKKIKKSQLKLCFSWALVNMLICLVGLTIQSVLGKRLSIPLIYYEYIVYIGTVFLPVSFLFIGVVFANTKIQFKKKHLLLFVMPIISLLILWTNNMHNLMYKTYSIILQETQFGIYNNIYLIYFYTYLVIGIYYLLKYSIKNAGFFSKQSILIILGTLIPIVVNILGTFNIISMTIYVTPISFAFTTILFALAIFKFKFLSVTPIAMQRIVDRMSDSFLVVNEDNIITDFNNTFVKAFKLSEASIRNKNFSEFVSSKRIPNIDIDMVNDTLKKCKTTTETILFKKEFNIANKYFNGCPIVAITNIPPWGACNVHSKNIDNAPVTAEPAINAGIVLNGSADANGIAPSDINDNPII